MPPLKPDVLLAHRAFLAALARELLRDADRAEDIAQEGMIAAWQRPPSGPNVRGWFRAVGRNLVRSARRADDRRDRREAAAARPDRLPSAAEQVARVELQRRVVDEVLALDEPYRSTVIARYLDDRSVADIATDAGISRETVKTRLRRALVQLRGRLDASQEDGQRHWSFVLASLAAEFSVRGTALTEVLVVSSKTKLWIVACAALALVLVVWNRGRGDGNERPRNRAEANRRDETRRSSLAPPATERAFLESNVAAAFPTEIDRRVDLHGVVVDAAGAPIEGAQLQAVHRDWQQTDLLARHEGRLGVKTNSAADGSFRLRLRFGDRVRLRARAAGYARTERCELNAGERVRIVLQPAAALRVRVEDVLGAPVANARVTLRSTDEETAIDRVAVTDREGSVRFDDLSRAARVRVSAVHPEHGALLDDPECGTDETVKIVLPRGIVFSGRVLDDATGKPVPNARVGMNWTMEPETRTGEDGRFHLNGFLGPSIFHAIRVEARGYAPSSAVVRSRIEFEVRLVREARVRGCVVDGKGKPVVGARVAAVSSGGFEEVFCAAYAVTEGDGSFWLEGLVPGSNFDLAVAAEGLGRRSLPLRWGTKTPVVPGTVVDVGKIVMDAERTVDGRVLDAGGRPIPRVKVEIRGPQSQAGGRSHLRGTSEVRRTDDLGRFRFRSLSDGRYVIKVTRPGAAGVVQKFGIEGGDVRDLEIRLATTRTFVVRVVDETGAAVPQAELILDDDTGTSRGFTNDKGTRTFEVTGRIHELRLWFVFPADGEPVPSFGPVAPLTDIPDTKHEVTLRLQRWERIVGVVSLDDKPLARARIELSWRGGQGTTRTGRSGAFSTLVPPGAEVTLRVVGREIDVGRGAFATDPSVDSEPVVAAAGARDVVLRARTVPQNRSLRVRVLDPNGNPLAGVHLGYGPTTPGDPKSWDTDEDGWATLDKLPSRRLRIYAYFGEQRSYERPKMIELVPDGRELVMRCRVARRVTGSGTAAGKVAAGANIEVHAGDEEWHGECDDEGRFSFAVPHEYENAKIVVRWRGTEETSWAAEVVDADIRQPVPIAMRIAR